MFTVDQYREVIKCGFLVKSPPFIENSSGRRCFRRLSCAKAYNGLFKKRWRERYCVLYKIRFRDKTEIFFEYYKDSQCSKLKGRVDLENCDCITDHVPFGKWSNVFSVQTLHNGQKRVYYFAAPNQQNMWDWVRNLVEVTGFVADSSGQVPLLPGVRSGAMVAFGSQRDPSIRHMPEPVSALVTSSWLAESKVCSGTDVSHSRFEGGYRDPLSPEMDYMMTGPEDEHDGYYRLPGLSHSYVNLTSNAEKTELQSSASAPKDFPSCPQLAVLPPARLNDPAACIPPRPARLAVNPKVCPNGDAPTGSSGVDSIDPKRRNSTNSLYFNVWEAGNEEGREDHVFGPPTDPLSHPVGALEGDVATKTAPLPHQAPPRVFRRSQLISDYHQLLLPPPASSQPVAVTQPVPVRKPMPPPRTATRISATLPSSISKPLPTVESRLPPLPSINTDIDLPVRASSSPNVEDSSQDSSNSGSSDALVYSNSMVPDVPAENAPPCPVEGPAVGPRLLFPQSREGPTYTETLMTSRLLNYIEPCNLDLSSVPPSSSVLRSATGTLSVAVPAIIGQPTPTNNSITDRSDDAESGCQSISDDYKTEYNEIDPVGTNALAIVNKRYLDNDIPT